MKELELDKPQQNMFYKAINPEYGKLFQEVFDAGLDDRDRLMLEIYEKSKDDESLDEKKKKIILLSPFFKSFLSTNKLIFAIFSGFNPTSVSIAISPIFIFVFVFIFQ